MVCKKHLRAGSLKGDKWEFSAPERRRPVFDFAPMALWDCGSLLPLLGFNWSQLST
jgi:hypothetical protein